MPKARFTRLIVVLECTDNCKISSKDGLLLKLWCKGREKVSGLCCQIRSIVCHLRSTKCQFVFLSIAVQCYRKLEIGSSSSAENLFSESIFFKTRVCRSELHRGLYIQRCARVPTTLTHPLQSHTKCSLTLHLMGHAPARA